MLDHGSDPPMSYVLRDHIATGLVDYSWWDPGNFTSSILRCLQFCILGKTLIFMHSREFASVVSGVLQDQISPQGWWFSCWWDPGNFNSGV